MEEIIFFETPGATFGATLAGCLALATASGEAVYFFMRNRRNNELQAVSFQQIQTIVYEEIHKVREGVTIRKPFTAEISFNDDKKIPKTNIHLPLSDRKIFMTYSGMIVCGCDLDEIRFSQDVDNRASVGLIFDENGADEASKFLRAVIPADIMAQVEGVDANAIPDISQIPASANLSGSI